jgi:hypothetical protein
LRLYLKGTAMRGTNMSRLLFIALVLMSSAILPADTPDNPCCERKIVPAADAPARLTVTIRNLGAPLVGVLRTGPYYDFGISVKTDTGGEVGLTELGKRVLGQPHEGSAHSEDLWTGESLKEELDLSERFELKSGTYRVTLTRAVYLGGKGGTKVSLESTTEFKISNSTASPCISGGYRAGVRPIDPWPSRRLRVAGKARRPLGR